MDRRRNNNNNNDNESEEWSWWKIGGVVAGVAVGVAAIAGVIAHTIGQQDETVEDSGDESEVEDHRIPLRDSESGASYCSTYSSPTPPSGNGTVQETPINNLNSLLSDIYVRYVKLKDFKLHYEVFNRIFYSLHSEMKNVDRYYNHYSGMVQFAGSHYDRLRIKKPDEFDMDIVIGLPLNIDIDPINSNNSDFIIEPTDAGYVQLKMGVQFINLLFRDNWDINLTCYKWKNDDNYLLRSKFLDWFKSVVVRALNKLPKIFDGYYTVTLSESGPAITLKIRGKLDFKMDIDLVPCLRFPETRWPITLEYRPIPWHCKKEFFMVVPKPNKNINSGVNQTRSWRLALNSQERQFIYDTHNLRVAIKLMKKLRDAQEMTKIASYYIKTLVYWEVLERDDKYFGTKSVADLFKILVNRFHEALEEKNIPYIWNKNNNLLDGILPITLEIYAKKLKNLKHILEVPSEYKKVAKFLLSRSEFDEYSSIKNLL